MKMMLGLSLGLALIYMTSAAEVGDLKCPNNEAVAGFYSNKPFFKGYLTQWCSDVGEPVCQSVSKPKTVAQPYQTTFNVKCGRGQVIQRLIIKSDNKGKPTSMTTYCCSLVDYLPILGTYQVTSADLGNKEIDCGKGAALFQLTLEVPDSGSTTATGMCALLSEYY